jgi:hypothetical protein
MVNGMKGLSGFAKTVSNLLRKSQMVLDFFGSGFCEFVVLGISTKNIFLVLRCSVNFEKEHFFGSANFALFWKFQINLQNNFQNPEPKKFRTKKKALNLLALHTHLQVTAAIRFIICREEGHCRAANIGGGCHGWFNC